MPNGGRQGDNPQSWFMDALCRGEETYLGEPIDSLACEIYRVSKNESAAGIYRDDNKDKIDPIALEAKLRARLAEVKETRIQRIENWANNATLGTNYYIPEHMFEAVKDTVKYAMNYSRDYMKKDSANTRQIDELMDVLSEIPERINYLDESGVKRIKNRLRGFDRKKWKGAPDFVAYLESRIEHRP